MVNSRTSNPGEPDFLSVADLRIAFDSFGVADSLRLDKTAQYLGWKCRTDGGELVGEAVMRALNGDRRCPRDLAAVQFLIGVMRSLASEINEKRNSDPLARRTDDDPHALSGALACCATEQPDPEETLMVTQQEETMQTLVREIEALFIDDDEALRVLRGQMIGMSAEEIRRQGSIGRSAYNTARRRIRRRIDKAYPNGWNR
jgi:RNA polymerase sigma-70 factor (ECF subfamily)